MLVAPSPPRPSTFSIFPRPYYSPTAVIPIPIPSSRFRAFRSQASFLPGANCQGPIGQFAPWNFCSLANSVPGHFAPWNFHSPKLLLPEVKWPRNFHSLEVLLFQEYSLPVSGVSMGSMGHVPPNRYLARSWESSRSEEKFI